MLFQSVSTTRPEFRSRIAALVIASYRHETAIGGFKKRKKKKGFCEVKYKIKFYTREFIWLPLENVIEFREDKHITDVCFRFQCSCYVNIHTYFKCRSKFPSVSSMHCQTLILLNYNNDLPWYRYCHSSSSTVCKIRLSMDEDILFS